jgi:hypothetical protein
MTTVSKVAPAHWAALRPPVPRVAAEPPSRDSRRGSASSPITLPSTAADSLSRGCSSGLIPFSLSPNPQVAANFGVVSSLSSRVLAHFRSCPTSQGPSHGQDGGRRLLSSSPTTTMSACRHRRYPKPPREHGYWHLGLTIGPWLGTGAEIEARGRAREAGGWGGRLEGVGRHRVGNCHRGQIKKLWANFLVMNCGLMHKCFRGLNENMPQRTYERLVALQFYW